MIATAARADHHRHYANTARVTSRDGEIDYIAIERCLNDEPVQGLTETEQRYAAGLLHARQTPIAVIARRVGAGESRVKTWLGLHKKPAARSHTRGAADRRH